MVLERFFFEGGEGVGRGRGSRAVDVLIDSILGHRLVLVCLEEV